MMESSITRRLNELERRLHGVGALCHPAHGQTVVILLREDEPDPEPQRCPGCGDALPVLLLCLRVVPATPAPA
jgi:hypothetical protein